MCVCCVVEVSVTIPCLPAPQSRVGNWSVEVGAGALSSPQGPTLHARVTLDRNQTLWLRGSMENRCLRTTAGYISGTYGLVNTLQAWSDYIFHCYGIIQNTNACDCECVIVCLGAGVFVGGCVSEFVYRSVYGVYVCVRCLVMWACVCFLVCVSLYVHVFMCACICVCF